MRREICTPPSAGQEDSPTEKEIAAEPSALQDEIEQAGLITAVEQSADAVVITDTSGNIQYVNPAFSAMTGYSREEALGQNPRVLKSGRHSVEFYQDLWSTVASGQVWRGEVTNRRKDGAFYTEEMRITPVRDSKGEIVRYIAIKQDVTERRAAEDAKRFLASIVESSNDAIISGTLDGTILSWNKSAEKLFGYTRDEIVGKNYAVLAPLDRRAEFAQGLAQVRTGNVYQYDTVRQAKDGRLIDVTVTGSPIRNAAGKWVGVSAIIRDISGRVRAEKKLRESEERFRSAFENAPIGMSLQAVDGRYLQVNQALCRMLGYSEEELLGAKWLELIHPDDRENNRKLADALFSGQSDRVDLQKRYLHRSGKIVLARVQLSLVRDSAGKPLHVVVQVEDITECKRADDALRESEERFRIMADGCPAVMWVTNSEGGLEFINEAYRKFYNTTYKKVAGSDWAVLLHPDDAPPFLSAFEQAVAQRTPFAAETRTRRADGEWRWLASHGEPRFSTGGEFLGHVGLSLDITERKQAEEAIQSSEEKFRQLAENIHQVFCLVGRTGSELLYVSPGYEQIWGRSCESLYRNPRSWLEAIEPEFRDEAALHLEKRKAGESIVSEYRIRRPDGVQRWIRDRAFPVRDKTGKVIRIAGIAEDITDRKRYEEELVQAREAADAANLAKSRFLANMSHEIRTPMNGVLGMLQLLCGTNLTVEQREYASVIDTSGRTLLALIDDILDLAKIEAHKVTLERVDFNPCSATEEVVQILRSTADAKRLALSWRAAPETPTRLCGDPNRLRQVLMNLTANAIKFTERGEVSLLVAVESQDADKATLRFSVSDTGIGIDPEHGATLFSPFVQADTSNTRKYGGTGLGLSISKQLVEMMGGRIGFNSKVGDGSTFWFTAIFDTRPEPASVPSVEGTRALCQLTAKQDARILVAEDNPTNRFVLTAQLTKLGYQFQAVASGTEAIEAVQREKYDLVLMDCQMPGIDGFEATQQIRQSGNQELPIIAVTAHAMTGDRERCVSAGMNDYLSKPVDMHQLAGALAKWLPECVAQDPSLPVSCKPSERLVEERHHAGQAMQGFLKDFPFVLHDLRTRLDEADGPGAALQAHALQEAAAAVSARGLCALARAMAQAGTAGNLDEFGELLPLAAHEFDRLKNSLRHAGQFGS